MGLSSKRYAMNEAGIFTFEFQRIDDISDATYPLQQELLQERDAQERRWLLALELHSYFIRKLLKKPSFSSSSIKLSSKSCSMAASVIERPSRCAIICTPMRSPSPRTTLGGKP